MALLILNSSQTLLFPVGNELKDFSLKNPLMKKKSSYFQSNFVDVYLNLLFEDATLALFEKSSAMT